MYLPIRPTYAVRQGLRVTLLRLEQSLDSVEDAEALAELKRIAELDAAEDRETAAAANHSGTGDREPE